MFDFDIEDVEFRRKLMHLSRRQFILSNFLLFDEREQYFQAVVDKLDEPDPDADPNIPYPDNAEDLERLRLHTTVSRRWWVESHLDDQQKQAYLGKYGDEVEKEEKEYKMDFQ